MVASPGTAKRPLRVAVVGSGPSGFYAVASLFKRQGLEVLVDVFDRLPTPFGLVRGGVAPDHQKIKNVIRVYNKTADKPGFRFFGNVMIGRDLSVEDLRRYYDQIVYAVGNESDRKMEISGEDLEGVYSATEFVGWYNAHPDFQGCQFDLANAKRIAVVGNGNVAMDVTRVLIKRPDELVSTDITDESLAVLRQSAVEEIHLLGRRGPAQAAFSPKEIKEIGSLDDVDLIVSPEDVRLDEFSQTWLETQAAPSARKNVEYLKQKSAESPSPGNARVLCRFAVSPVEFLGSDGRLEAVRIEHNELYGDEQGTPRPRGTGRFETLEVDMVFKAVGYRGTPLEGVPFHQAWGIFANDEGRLTDPDSGATIPGQYVVGWAKRGPSGLIGTNGPDSEATVDKMIEDLESGVVPEAPEPDPEAIAATLRERNVDFVSFEDWNQLDGAEISRGEAKGKVRDKYTDIAGMMEAIQKLRAARV